MTENVIAQRRNNGKAKARSAASKALSYAFLILTAVVVLFPFYIALVTSFKTRVEAMNVEFTWWPKEFSLHGYKDVLTYKGSNAITIPLIVLGFLNTLWMVVPRSLISTVLAGMAAYAYAKLRFRAKNGMFGFLIATMMIPGVITLIPSYLMFYWLGWLTTPLPVILRLFWAELPACFSCGSIIWACRARWWRRHVWTAWDISAYISKSCSRSACPLSGRSLCLR